MNAMNLVVHVIEPLISKVVMYIMRHIEFM